MKRKDWQDGLEIIFPVMLGYIPLGLACGMLLYDAGFDVIPILLMSLLVFAGAAQFMAASMVIIGATAPTIILMVFFLNIRHLLMSSSLSKYFKKKSSTPFILLFSHTLADEAYAINYTQFQKNEWTEHQALATNVLAYLTWAISTTVGGWLGSALTIDITIMNYVLIAMFIALLINQLVSKLFVIVGLVAGGLSVVLMQLLHHNIALVIAAILASLFGYWLDSFADEQKSKEVLD